MDGMDRGVIMWYLVSWKYRLGLEIKGIGFRGGSTYAFLKKTFGYKGSRQSVLDQYTADLKEAGYLTDE
jgi:hypothetical protein